MKTPHLDFEQARTKHLLFKAKLRSILYGLEVDEKPVVSHTECTVGKWIYEHAQKQYGQFPEMQELEIVHADLHRFAKVLVDKYHSGLVSEARSGLVEMESIAGNLVAVLTRLEDKIKSEDSQMPSYQDVSVSIQELNELVKSNYELDSVIKSETAGVIRDRWLLQEAFMQIPASISILRGPEHIIEFANPEVFKTLEGVDFLGKKVRDILPELESQGYIALLDNVYKTGESFIGKEMKAVVFINGKQEEFYFNVSYSAIRTQLGEMEGILAFSYDVSEQVRARNVAEDAATRLKQAYEDLEVKVKFRNLELERSNMELQQQIADLKKNN